MVYGPNSYGNCGPDKPYEENFIESAPELIVTSRSRHKPSLEKLSFNPGLKIILTNKMSKENEKLTVKNHKEIRQHYE